MEKGMFPAPARQRALAARLTQSNEVSERYGLSLSDAQVRSLIAAEGETLRACGRLEFGEGILPRLIVAFCDSPFINRSDYADTLRALQELFYTYKNELEDALSDDELLDAMQKLFNGKAQGSLEYLENISADRLTGVLRSDDTDGNDGDDDFF